MNNKSDRAAMESEIEEEIERARIRLSSEIPATQRAVVLEMGRGLEKLWKGKHKNAICEQIKTRLSDEIARGLISRRSIEAYSLPEWKDRRMAEFGRTGAETQKRKAAKSAALTPELESDHGADESKPEMLIEVGSSSQTLQEGEDDRHHPDHPVEGSNRQPSESKVSAETMVAETEQNAGQGGDSKLEFEFSLPYEAVQSEILKRLASSAATARLWFNGVIHRQSGRVLHADVGRLDDREDLHESSER